MSTPNWWGDWRPTLTPHTGNLLATDLIECTMIVGGVPVNTVITGAQILGAVPSGGLTVGTTAIASGTVGRVLFQGTGNVLQQSANLFWDNTNGRLGVGTSLPNMALDIRTGNVGIGVTSDAGFKLDVNGTARVSGQITTTTANAQFGTIGASTGNFRIDGVNGGTYAFAVYSSNTLRFGVVGFGGISMPNGFTIVSGSTDLTTTRLRIGTGNSTAVINIQAQAGNADIVSFKASSGTDQFKIKNTSGNILVGTPTDVPSSKLTIESTTQGFLPPRMTTAQKNAIASPAVGLVVYDTTLAKLCVRTASAWETITSI